MTTSVWFVVPAHGRVELTRVCLRQLRRTCDIVARDGVEATAVVIACDENLDTARSLGFATVDRDNEQLGRRFNDGFQLACDPDYNPAPADHVIPFGSDDWIDPQILNRFPGPGEIGTWTRLAIVNEDRTRICRVRATHMGGAGPRIIPRQLIAGARYRPAEEDARIGLDFSILRGIRTAARGRVEFPNLDVHPLQIVDWKTAGQQLHSYRSLKPYRRGEETGDPFGTLEEIYPAAVAEMRALTEPLRVAA